jgi:hypothetical protein
MKRTKKLVIGAVLLLAAAAAFMGVASNRRPSVVRAQTAIGGPIHGYVGAVLASEAVTAAVLIQRPVINLPNISVTAKNLKTQVSSDVVITNPQGYFRTDTLPPGLYQICVQGTGYISSCDEQRIEIISSTHVMDHTVAIRSASGVIEGTVRLADQVTPCFWFRPAFSTQTVIAAQVSLLDGNGNVLAGPVSGNSVGQYVLPVTATGDTFTLRAVCQAMTATPAVRYGGGVLQRDIVIRNSPPQIASFSLTKGGVGVRRANPGDVLQAAVTATDPDGDTLHYLWTDDSGRSLGLPDAPTVTWPLPNVSALNTLRVQVSDGNGGFAVSQQSLRAGPDKLIFGGTLVGRATGAAIAGATVSVNGLSTTSSATGAFQVAVPDASRFILNVSKPGIALVSRVFYNRNTQLQIPLDTTQTATVNGATGGGVVMPTGECDCDCEEHHGGDKDHHYADHGKDDQYKSHDQDHGYGHDGDHGRDYDHKKPCKPTKGQLSMKLDANALIDAHGNPFTGTASIEMFQYDTTLPNPIPGDQGATSGGTTVRLATFGAFYIQPRDGAGQPLQMAANKTATVTMPIEPTLLAKAPASVPFLRYDEGTGLWTEAGTLTRSGNNYVGTINHFSVFNADTEFPGGACVKVILDPDSFTLPLALDATYVDPASGQFHHNGTQVTTNPVGVERMTPNVNFTLSVFNAANTTLLKSVTLNSGPGLNPAQFPSGLDTDTVNFSHCNGPVTIFNGNVPTGPTFLMPITGGVITDNSAAYQAANNANPGGTRDTFPHWLTANGFTSGEPQAIYFNNGDLKFGRNMHCLTKNAGTGAAACYVQNFGDVGEDDSVTALADARSATSLVATVTMEYDPTATNGESVQFWAYDSSGNYLPHPTLDGQGGKPIPDICLSCHGGYFNSGTGKARGAIFLAFDLDSFLYDTPGDPHTVAAAQTAFRELNQIVLNTNPDGQTGDSNKPVTQLMNLWYPTGVATPGAQFSFNHAVAANQGGFPANGPLYDDVVKPVCRTCHTAQGSSIDWTSFSQMNSQSTQIQLFACGGGTPAAHQTFNFAMPHAQVPFKNLWLNSLSSTLSSELSLSGCPNQ